MTNKCGAKYVIALCIFLIIKGGPSDLVENFTKILKNHPYTPEAF